MSLLPLTVSSAVPLTFGVREHNMVRFHNGTPVGIYYSQHIDGVGFKWDDSTINITDGRVGGVMIPSEFIG